MRRVYGDVFTELLPLHTGVFSANAGKAHGYLLLSPVLTYSHGILYVSLALRNALTESLCSSTKTKDGGSSAFDNCSKSLPVGSMVAQMIECTSHEPEFADSKISQLNPGANVYLKPRWGGGRAGGL